jgi:CelD/BcsL family acetyltransferase involved in cellulose biosynthesis
MVEVHGSIETVADMWDDLAEGVQAVPWVRRGWIEAWLNVFGRGRVEIWALTTGGHLAALMPLVRHRNALFSPTNWHTPAFAPVADSRVAAVELVEAVLRKRARRVDLRFLAEESLDVGHLRARAERAGYRTISRVLMRSPYVALDGTWPDYESRLSKNLRGDVSRRRRRLEEAGDVSITVENGREHLESLLTEGFRTEAAGWKLRKGTAIVSSPRTELFYRLIAKWARDEGWLRLAFLRLDTRPLAFHFDIEVDGVLYHLKGGYDANYEQYSPGKVLHHEMLSRAFERGLTRYDFLGSEEPYKLAWASETKARCLVQAFDRSPGGAAEWAAFRYGRPLAKRILSLAR